MEYIRMLFVSGWLMSLATPVSASSYYSREQCQEIATAIVKGQRVPLSKKELADLDGETVRCLTSCLAQAQTEAVKRGQPVSPAVDQSTHDPKEIQQDQLAGTSRPTVESRQEELRPLSKRQQQFIAELGPTARKIAQEHDLYASVLIAQAILESNWGQSDLAGKHHNLFGIKGQYQGQGVLMPTTECLNGHDCQVTASFRKYPSVKESLQDYATVLDQPIYALAHKQKCSRYQDATLAIGKVYATDPDYHGKLNHLITTYHLDQYDQEGPAVPQKTSFDQEAPRWKTSAENQPHQPVQKEKRKGIVLPLIGGLGSMSIVELVRRLIK